MPKQLQKSFQEYLSKLKGSGAQIQLPLRGCRHPKTLSFGASSNEKENDAVSMSEIDRFFLDNMGTLCPNRHKEEISAKSDAKELQIGSPTLDLPPLEDLCSSQRFFFPSSSSSSIISDEACSTTATNDTSSASGDASEKDSMAPDDFIALLTYSPDPYQDFRRSMQEMVDARLEHNGKVDWEFLEELLFCYLELNNKKSSRYILRAFVDTIVELRENSG